MQCLWAQSRLKLYYRYLLTVLWFIENKFSVCRISINYYSANKSELTSSKWAVLTLIDVVCWFINSTRQSSSGSVIYSFPLQNIKSTTPADWANTSITLHAESSGIKLISFTADRLCKTGYPLLTICILWASKQIRKIQ